MSRRAHGGRFKHLRNAEQGFSVRRSVDASLPGLLRIRQRIVARAPRLGTDVTGPYWVFAVVTVQSRPMFVLPFRTMDDMMAAVPGHGPREPKLERTWNPGMRTPRDPMTAVAS